jgi:hypothetical protein
MRVEEGALFRRLIGRAQIGGALNSGSVSLIFKRVAQWIGMPARYVASVSWQVSSSWSLISELAGRRSPFERLFAGWPSRPMEVEGPAFR